MDVKVGDIVRITSDNRAHGGKVVLVTDTYVSTIYDSDVMNRTEIVFQILLDGKIKNNVAMRWLEVINESR